MIEGAVQGAETFIAAEEADVRMAGMSENFQASGGNIYVAPPAL